MVDRSVGASDGVDSVGVPSNGTEGTQAQLLIASGTSLPQADLIALASRSPSSRGTSMITDTQVVGRSVGWTVGGTAYGEREGLEQRGTASHGDGRSVMVPTTSEAGDSVDPSGYNTMALQHLSNQGICPSSGHFHTTVSGSAGTPRPMRTRRSHSRSRTPIVTNRHTGVGLC